MPRIPFLRIFLSSPGDVLNERQIALDIIERLPDRPTFREKVAFRVIAWEKPGHDTPMLGSFTPQEAINRGLPRPSECDIVIVLFWSRLGTPFVDSDGTEYLSGTHWELLDALGSENTQTIIYRRSEEPVIEVNDEASRRQYFELGDFFNSEMFFKDGKVVRGVNSYASPDDFRAKFESHLEDLVLRLLENFAAEPESLTEVLAANHANIKTVVTKIWEGSPFPGLRAFTPADAPIFFGRGYEVDALIEKLRQQRFVAVVGASGSGKSSLIGAGLQPRLKANVISSETVGSKDWFFVRFVPGTSPYENLAEALIDMIPALNVDDPIEYPDRLDKLTDSLKNGPDRLDKMLRYALKQEKPWAEVLLFVDQFEELFTLAPEEERAGFTELLMHASEKIRVIVTMRADFYHRAVPYLERPLRDGTFTLSQPTAIALYEMITRPAELAALEMEDGLPARIVEDTGSDPGALALMAYALDELYKITEQRGDRAITFADYNNFGGVQGAIGTRAEGVFSRLPGSDDEKQSLVRRVFYKLVAVDQRGTATRTRAALSTVQTDEASTQLISALTEARLLVQTSGDENEPVVEVAHEALFSSWPLLREIIEDIEGDLILLRQLQHAAADWEERGKNPVFLWSHERLIYVYEMLERLNNPDLSPLVREFVKPEQERLIEELDDIDVSHIRRTAIGHRLSLIGDPRPGVLVRPDSLPDVVWVPVPAGKVEIEGYGTWEVPAFYAAKYLVTHAQFDAFIKGGGYDEDRWWQGLYCRETAPPDQITLYDNCPRDSLRWTDAVAYSRWLNERLSNAPGALPEGVEIGLDWQIRLPTEWEWQQAATGGNPDNVFPWGPEWDARLANTREARLSITNSVGMYPAGATVAGALDMAGNICEWCHNIYDDIHNIDTQNDAFRVRRGGSCNHGQEVAMTTHRFHYDPRIRYNHDLGCRVVLAPPLA